MTPCHPVFLVPFSLVAILLAGCATPKHLSHEFGDAFTQTFEAQVMNPAAPVNPNPVATMPGSLANTLYKNKYEGVMTNANVDNESSECSADIMDD